MTSWTCEKLVDEPVSFRQKKCGKPAKYVLNMSNGTMLLCGIHARKHIKAQLPWRKVTPLVKPKEEVKNENTD